LVKTSFDDASAIMRQSVGQPQAARQARKSPSGDEFVSKSV
jgi:hypothetical protein